VNNVPVATLDSAQVEIAKARSLQAKFVNIGFATITKQSMLSQKVIPQLYYDQLNIVGKHLWDIANDPEWSSDIENFLPLLETIRKDPMHFSPADQKHSVHSLKKQQNGLKRFSRPRTIGKTGN